MTGSLFVRVAKSVQPPDDPNAKITSAALCSDRWFEPSAFRPLAWLDGFMACCLVARNGQRYLSPRAVVARLVSEFPSVTSSEEDGRRYVRGIIERLVAIRRSGDIPVDNEYLERLAKAESGAIYVYFEDWSSATLHLGMVIIPEEPLFFTYSSTAQERAAYPMLVRCARVLDYEIVDT